MKTLKRIKLPSLRKVAQSGERKFYSHQIQIAIHLRVHRTHIKKQAAVFHPLKLMRVSCCFYFSSIPFSVKFSTLLQIASAAGR